MKDIDTFVLYIFILFAFVAFVLGCATLIVITGHGEILKQLQ